MKDLFPYERRQDWQVRWVEFIKDCLDIAADLRLDPDWGVLNCIQWSCSGIEELTGHNPYEELQFHEEVKSVATATRAVTSRGYKTLDQLLGSLFYEVPVGMCQSGDLVMAQVPNVVEGNVVFPHAAVLADPPFYWCVTPEGLAKGDLYQDGRIAFAVGRRT